MDRRADVYRDAVEPCLKGTVALELTEFLRCLYENFLGSIFGILSRYRMTQRNGQHEPLMLSHKCRKSYIATTLPEFCENLCVGLWRHCGDIVYKFHAAIGASDAEQPLSFNPERVTL
jgi:hypothetical protein